MYHCPSTRHISSCSVKRRARKLLQNRIELSVTDRPTKNSKRHVSAYHAATTSLISNENGVQYADHSVQYGDQYAPRLQNSHVADQLVGERHEVNGAEDPCGLVAIHAVDVLQDDADQVSNV